MAPLFLVGCWPLNSRVHGRHYHRLALNMLLGNVRGLPRKQVKAYVYLAVEARIEEGLPVLERYLDHIRRGEAILGCAVTLSGAALDCWFTRRT